MLHLSSQFGGSYVGLTLSERQAAVGRAAIERARRAQSIQILVRSYDAPPAGPFDLIVAIESLAHSADPAVSVRVLADRLVPGGLMAIVDDMPRSRQSSVVSRQSSSDLQAFKTGWGCPVLWSAEEYAAQFAQSGLTCITDVDLTPFVTPRTLARIRQLDRLNRLMQYAVPSAGWRGLMRSYHGGLALERLYRRADMTYHLMIGARAQAWA